MEDVDGESDDFGGGCVAGGDGWATEVDGQE